MNRLRKSALVFAMFFLVSGLAVADASAQHRHYRGYAGYYRPYYNWGVWGYWSPWYGPWPWYGPYWGPYYMEYHEPTGALRLQVTPRNTQVYVDGYFVGVVDDFDGTFQRLRVPPGGHEIALHLPGYRNATQSLYVAVGTTVNLKHAMEPLPAGTPEEPLPRPNPAAAEAAQPRAPEPSRQRPPRGDDRIREAGFGSLAIRAQPPDATVFIDGTEWRGAADDDGEVLVQVPAGRHRVELRRNGYGPYSTEVDVRAGVTTPLNVMLQRDGS